MRTWSSCWIEFWLTRELCPARHWVVDGADSESAQAIIVELSVTNPKPQQDAVDLLLGGGLHISAW